MSTHRNKNGHPARDPPNALMMVLLELCKPRPGRTEDIAGSNTDSAAVET